MNNNEKIIDLLLGAAQPRNEYPPGERDRNHARNLARWQSLRAAGFLQDEAEFQEIMSTLNSGLDYQRDHPLNEIDRTLDSAMAIARDLDKHAFYSLAALVDLPVRQRLVTYSVRCASRVLTNKSQTLCEAAMLAYLLVLNSSDDEKDNREMMVSLAPLHVAAQSTKSGATALFEQYADYAPESLRETMNVFGRRTDVTLRAFAWALEKRDSIDWIVLAA